LKSFIAFFRKIANVVDHISMSVGYFVIDSQKLDGPVDTKRQVNLIAVLSSANPLPSDKQHRSEILLNQPSNVST
jgi:hypothetical protein